MTISSIRLTVAAVISIAASFFLGSLFLLPQNPKPLTLLKPETLLILPASACRRERKLLASRVRELEASLDASTKKAASERRGRVRAQQDLRKSLAQWSPDGLKPDSSSSSSYPMSSIGTVRSCFSTRNGTPRQPLLVALSRACLVFNPSQVPSEALEGLAEYSHYWVLYVFHLNTDLVKAVEGAVSIKIQSKG